ncbi:MAG: hypothetical protein HY898_13845 [Deltaproteobacteria bacterium]|nr:hypothetical protein [Deltaproteobacteria bacterium]
MAGAGSSMRRSATRMTRILVIALVLGSVVPFLPLVYLTGSGYREDVAKLEVETREANEHIADLASRYLDTFAWSIEQELALSASNPVLSLPTEPPAVVWEVVDPSGRVQQSGRSKDRIGTPCGYERMLSTRPIPTGMIQSPVDRWLPEDAPTVLFARWMAASGMWLVARVDPEGLRREMIAWSGAQDGRHLYVVDAQGGVLLYSDQDRTVAPIDLNGNPPIKMFLEGGKGSIRFKSIVSGKDRLGHVSRTQRTQWGAIVTADVGQSVIGVRSRYMALVWSILFGGGAALAILMWTTRRLARPILQIRDAIRAERGMALHPLSVPESARRVAEYDELVSAFDELSERVARTEKQLLHAERVASVGQLASGLAHEIGTPLNVIRGNAQHALRKMDNAGTVRAAFELIVEQTERIAEMIRRLLDYARPTETRMVPIELPSIVAQSIEMAHGLNPRVEVRMDIDPDTPPVMGDPAQLEQAILNLLVNAYQAMPHGGTLSVIVGADSEVPGDGEDWVCCKVIDNGCGIHPEVKDRLFQPFVTTKSHGQGTGLGLAIVDRIVRRHGARIDVQMRREGGSIFALHLRPARVGEEELTGE